METGLNSNGIWKGHCGIVSARKHETGAPAVPHGWWYPELRGDETLLVPLFQVMPSYVQTMMSF